MSELADFDCKPSDFGLCTTTLFPSAINDPTTVRTALETEQKLDVYYILRSVDQQSRSGRPANR